MPNSTTSSQELHQKLVEIDQLVNQIEQLFTEQNQLRYAINSSEIDSIESVSELSKFIDVLFFVVTIFYQIILIE